MNKQASTSLKIALTGDASVGKTALIEREVQNQYHKARTTVGTDFKVKYYQTQNVKIKAQLWNGIGQTYEKLQSMNRLYYKDAFAIGLCFSMNNKASFENLEKRINIIKNCNKDAKLFLIGCKSDTDAVISEDSIAQFVTKNQLKYFKTSAKLSLGVTQAFQQMVQTAFCVKQMSTFPSNHNQAKETGNPQRSFCLIM